MRWGGRMRDGEEVECEMGRKNEGWEEVECEMGRR